ncbi:hypothetical protein D3C86_2130710 [compost metagenome]
MLRLAERYGDVAVEAACRRAVSYENWRIASLEAILSRKEVFEEEPLPDATPLPAGFARSASYFVHVATGVEVGA